MSIYQSVFIRLLAEVCPPGHPKWSRRITLRSRSRIMYATLSPNVPNATPPGLSAVKAQSRGDYGWSPHYPNSPAARSRFTLHTHTRVFFFSGQGNPLARKGTGTDIRLSLSMSTLSALAQVLTRPSTLGGSHRSTTWSADAVQTHQHLLSPRH